MPVLLHHSEPADPTLLAWIRDQIDALLGVGPPVLVIGLGVVIVALPVAIGVAAMRQRRHPSHRRSAR